MGKVTRDHVNAHGWNSPEHDSIQHNAAVQAAQLNLIGLLLVEIRDLLAGDTTPDTKES